MTLHLRLLVLATVPPKSATAHTCCNSSQHPNVLLLPIRATALYPSPSLCHALFTPCPPPSPNQIYMCSPVHPVDRRPCYLRFEHTCILSDLDDLTSSSLQTSRCFSNLFSRVAPCSSFVFGSTREAPASGVTCSVVASTCMVHASARFCNAPFSLRSVHLSCWASS